MTFVVLILAATTACGRVDEQSNTEGTSPILAAIAYFILALLAIGCIRLIIRWNKETRERDGAFQEIQEKQRVLNAHEWIARHSNPDPMEIVATPDSMVEWNGIWVTDREAEVIEAEMRARGETRRQQEKLQTEERAETKAKALTKEHRLSAERAYADALLFVHAYESLERLLPAGKRRLDAPNRDPLIAELTGTTSDVVEHLRGLRNRVAHKERYSSKEIRAGKQCADNLLRNAHLLRNARSARAQRDDNVS